VIYGILQIHVDLKGWLSEMSNRRKLHDKDRKGAKRNPLTPVSDNSQTKPLPIFERIAKPENALENKNSNITESLSELAGTSTPEGTASHRQFLEKLLDTFNNRRSAVDSRATIICTISLAMFGFLLTQGPDIFKSLPATVRYIMIALVIAPTFGAVAYSLSLIAPLRRPRKERKTKMKSLTWFYKIPEQTLSEYQASVKGLTESELIDQTSKQVYELSVLLKTRYDRLLYACWYLEIAIILLFAFLVVTYIRIIGSGGQ
jgi:hypothetical protein